MEMQAIEWKTAKGSEIRVAIETTEANLADSRVRSSCYNLIVRGNGSDIYLGSGFDVIEHADVGPALKGWFSNTIIPVPAAKLDAVIAMISAYRAEVARRSNAALNAEAAYQTQYDAVANLLETGKA